MQDRNLDAEIVEKIYGWELCEIPPDCDGRNRCQILTPGGVLPSNISLPPKGKLHKGYMAANFSNDI